MSAATALWIRCFELQRRVAQRRAVLQQHQASGLVDGQLARLQRWSVTLAQLDRHLLATCADINEPLGA